MTTKQAEFRILAATDDSAHARAAVATLLDIPWPTETQVRAVIASRDPAYGRWIVPGALNRSVEGASASVRRTLARRWSNAEVVVVDKAPVEAILEEAKRFRADAIAIGWRGHGAVRRLLTGSVSRGVVRGAKCSVLVVRRRPPRLRRIVIGFDGSPNALRAVQLVAKLIAPLNGRVTLISVVELLATTALAPRIGGLRATIAREVRRLNTARAKAALKTVKRAAAQLERHGWRTRTELRTGEPLRELMAAVRTADPQLLVLGTRGTSGVRHLLLGSVAEGALNQCPVPVLLAR